MKKNAIILFVLFGIIMFNSCKEDVLTTINPKALSGDLGFRLNKPSLSSSVYDLTVADMKLPMDTITCTQPDYGFTAAVKYYVQVCFDSTELTNLQELSNTDISMPQKMIIGNAEMNNAIFLLYNKEMPNPSVKKDVFVRLRAHLSDAKATPLTDTTLVSDLYSNFIKLTVLPLYVKPAVSYDQLGATLRPWYLIGAAIGDGKWTNSIAGLGVSIWPMSMTTGAVYNSTGDGPFTYTGYFEAGKGFKLIRDPGSWNEQWGNSGTYNINNPVHNDGGSKDFMVPSSGYYTLNLNSITNTLSIIPADITPASHTATGIGLIGDFTSWGTDIAMTQGSATNNHIWYTEYTFTKNVTDIANEGAKFREMNNDWNVNWGGNYFPYGLTGTSNIPYKSGNYVIIFNDLDGCYYFIAK